MPGARQRTVRVGCSGWNYKHWAEHFYGGRPAREWLRRYAEVFDTVEVNNTFYRLPLESSVARWVEESPPGFVFAVKMSRYVTHVKRLLDLGRGLERFYERIGPLTRSDKLGPVLWQLPPNFRRDDGRLGEALDRLPDGRHAFEFRHPSWFAPETYEALRAQNVALVIGDRPEVKEFQSHELTADFTFVRFHHGSRGARGNYSETEIREWAGRIRRWRRTVDVYAYWNNDWEEFAIKNGVRLKELLGLKPAP